MTKLIWNGCDGYVELDLAKRDPDYRGKIKGETLYTQTEEHSAFPVIEIDEASVPIDDDGEMICDGIFISVSGKFYKAK